MTLLVTRFFSAFVFVLVVSNILIFLKALHEYFCEKRRTPDWVGKSQLLLPCCSEIRPSVILVHGFVGSPFDFKNLAQELRQKGFRVVIPCVPGQSRSDFAYFRGRYKACDYVDWLQALIEKERALTGKKPFLVGFSMGGTLSLIMASKKRVDRVVLIAPFFDLPEQGLSSVVSRLGWLFPVFPKMENGKINDTEAKSKYIPGSMLLSIPAFRILTRLTKMAENAVSDISQPGLVICSRNDRVASYSRIQAAITGIGSFTVKEYNKGCHVLLHDYQRSEIMKDIYSFLLF